MGPEDYSAAISKIAERRNDPAVVAESHAMKAAKPPFALVPYEAVELMADAFALGLVKYAQWEYLRSPLHTSVYVGAALRHLFKVMRYGPGAIDPDPRNAGIGATHLGCALASLAMLAATYRNREGLDDTRQETELA